MVDAIRVSIEFTKGSSSHLLRHREVVKKTIVAVDISKSSLRSMTSGLLGKNLHDTMPSKTFDWSLFQVSSKCVLVLLGPKTPLTFPVPGC